ncbi:MAG: hypothetical protein HYZ22_12750 [Chloroflexi bacterium]|nr:hypothetical protein [Chloroflexota bacterium]
MSKKKWLTVGIGVFACICIAGVWLLGVGFFRPALFNPFMPVYEYEIMPSVHEGYSHQTLTREGITYESDHAEFGLSTGGSDHQIGQTPMGGRLIEVAGQPDYVVLFDFMSPIGVFRKSGNPPFDWRAVDFTEMQLYPYPSSATAGTAPITSTDAALIKEALTPIREGTSAISPDQVHAGYQSFFLNLYSDQLYGMWYMIPVYVDETGQAYVAENTLSKEWFPANETFSNWVR